MRKNKVFLLFFLAWFTFFLSRQTLDMMIIIPLLFATKTSFFMVCLYKERGPIVILIMVSFFILFIISLIVIKVCNPIWEVSEWQPNAFGLLGVIFLWLGAKTWLSQKTEDGLPDKRFRSYFVSNVSIDNLGIEIIAEFLFSLVVFCLIIFGSYYLMANRLINIQSEFIFASGQLFIMYFTCIIASRFLLDIFKKKKGNIKWVFFILFRVLSLVVIFLFIRLL